MQSAPRTQVLNKVMQKDQVSIWYFDLSLSAKGQSALQLRVKEFNSARQLCVSHRTRVWGQMRPLNSQSSSKEIKLLAFLWKHFTEEVLAQDEHTGWAFREFCICLVLSCYVQWQVQNSKPLYPHLDGKCHRTGRVQRMIPKARRSYILLN